MEWLDKKNNWTIEVDITHRCNLTCRHCNRLCNADKKYNIYRTQLDMNEKHIDYLCSEIKKQPESKIKLIRIIGGEPLLSKILIYTIKKMEELRLKNFIEDIQVVTNGTLPIVPFVSQYVTYSPLSLSNMINNGIINVEDVYYSKNSKHRNISLTPNDFGKSGKLCDRVLICGINYSIYGFSFTSPCLATLMVFPSLHKYFFHELPHSYRDLIDDAFEINVCSKCCFALNFDEKSEIQLTNKVLLSHIGTTWKNQTVNNEKSYKEPNINWINNYIQ